MKKVGRCGVRTILLADQHVRFVLSVLIGFAMIFAGMVVRVGRGTCDMKMKKKRGGDKVLERRESICAGVGWEKNKIKAFFY